MAFGAVTVVDTDGAVARRLARTEVAMYLAVLADLDPTTELPDELTHGIRQPHVALNDHEGAGRLIPDEALARFAFAGTPDEIAAHACRLFDAGLDRIGVRHAPLASCHWRVSSCSAPGRRRRCTKQSAADGLPQTGAPARLHAGRRHCVVRVNAL